MRWCVLLTANLAISLKIVHTKKGGNRARDQSRARQSPVRSEVMAQASVLANELTVLGETKVRFHLGNIYCFWPVMIAWDLSHDCILGSDFFQHFQCQIHYDTGTFVLGATEIPIRYCKVTSCVCRIFLCHDKGRGTWN